MRKNTRKGFSLLEALVSLTVVVIVSIATITLMLTSARLDGENMRSFAAHNEAENAVECFRFAESENEFLQAFAKSLQTPVRMDVESAGESAPETLGFVKNDEGKWTFEQDGYVVTFTELDFGNNNNNFAYTASENGVEIYTFRYENGKPTLTYAEGTQS